MAKQNFIICLMGPTGIGKTQLSLRLSRELPCEIISVDSAKIYRGMDIGTAKPSADILKQIPHYLINICDPNETYSVAQFREEAFKKITEIKAKNKIPLLVGGTMLYFRLLQEGLSQLPSASFEIRAQLQAQAIQHGWASLHQQLARIDPISAAQVHQHDTQRIQRALEVYHLTGKPMSHIILASKKTTFPYQFLNLALFPYDRQALHKRIAERFMKMLEKGLVAEVEALYCKPTLSIELPAIRTVGYRQVWQYLAGELTQTSFPQKAIVATRQLAKRQLTWLRSWKDLHTFDAFANKTPDRFIQYITKRMNESL